MKDFTKNDSLLIKGIAVLIMIYYHSVALSGRAAFTLFGNILAKTGNICVSLFAFITVYGTAKSLRAREESGKVSIKKALNHSIISLYRSYLPAFVYAIVLSFLFDRLNDVIWSVETSTWRASYGNGWQSLVYALVNGTGLTHLVFGDFRYTLNQTWWYMSLAVLLVLFVILVYAARKNKLMWIIVASLYGILAVKRPMYFQYLMLVPFGVFLAGQKTFYKESLTDNAVVSLVLVIWGYLRIYASGPWNPVVDVIATYPIIVFLCLVTRKLRCVDPFVFFGKHSANLFYMHSFVYLYWRPVAFVVDKLRVGYLIFPVVVALTMLVSMPLEKTKNVLAKRNISKTNRASA